MSKRLLHVCQICGKKFATPKGVCGHQRMHSGLLKIWGLKDFRVCSLSMTENEKHEVIEAAINLVMLSQRVYDFAAIRKLLLGDDDDPMDDLELKLSQELKSDVFSEIKFSDAVASALRRRKLQKKTQCSYKCNVCDKSFTCYQALGGHQRLHRSIKEQLACKMEEAEDENSLFDSSESSSSEVSQDKKIVSQPASFDASQVKILHSVESKLDYSEELLSHSGFGKSSRCSKTEFSPLRSTKSSHSSYRFKICGKSFVCSQALSGHKTLSKN